MKNYIRYTNILTYRNNRNNDDLVSSISATQKYVFYQKRNIQGTLRKNVMCYNK